MQKMIAWLMVLIISISAEAQYNITLLVVNGNDHEPLAGANILYHKTDLITNQTGYATLRNVPSGSLKITISHTGYESKTERIRITGSENDTILVPLDIEQEEMTEVIIQSTRTSRTIRNTPTRIETIDGEELDEKNNMRPANVSMLLHESTGIQVQQTSATSGNANIRMQGLDGRYTQLLKDGYPNFGNFASGLSILEIPPLDLKQVEIIKGPASTLYGGGAIAGVVNFISKEPKEKTEADLILNQSHIGQTNLGGYISGKNGRLGISFLAQFNKQKAYDVDRDDFSEIPESENFTIAPRIFIEFNPSTKIMLGNSLTKGSNTGGDMEVIAGKANAFHTYFEKNKTTRNTTTLEMDKMWPNKSSFKLKQALSLFNRQIQIPGYSFAGTNTNSYTDLSFTSFSGNHTFITGINVMADRFRQRNTASQNAKTFTSGLYIQDTWDINDRLKLESGLRIDRASYQSSLFSKSQVFVLPRISALLRITDKISSRIGAGLGYKTPTIFTEQTESLQYQNVLPLNNIRSERSLGATADINAGTSLLPGLTTSVNQLFFFTRINSPLLLQEGPDGLYFINAGKPVQTAGFETNLKFIYKHALKLFAGYTFTQATAGYLPQQKLLPLLPRNKLNLTLMYEKEDNVKIGLEAYYTDRQYVYNGTQVPAFWELGLMAQKTFKKVTFFINFENFTDERQSKYKPVVNAPHNNPSFDEIWNHTEGFVVNGGLKLKW